MIKIFDSKKPGPNVVIMAGVHGDEPCGIRAFEKIMPTFRPQKGVVTFLIGNPKAVSVKRREYEANLNRMFRDDVLLSRKEKQTYEYRRSRELTPILQEADALLDIHSSTTPQTIPFVICEPQSYACVAKLPVKKVVSGIDELHPMGTDAYVNQSGGLGVCIECGNHSDGRAEEIAITAIYQFLNFFGVIKKEVSILPYKQDYVFADYIYKNKDIFTLQKDFAEFEIVAEGTCIGIDGEERVCAPYTGIILFPHSRQESDTEAFLFGRLN